jgi:hypothetical protein
LNIGLGIVLSFFGYSLLAMRLWDQSAFYLAGGMTLAALGIRALIRIGRADRASTLPG